MTTLSYARQSRATHANAYKYMHAFPSQCFTAGTETFIPHDKVTTLGPRTRDVLEPSSNVSDCGCAADHFRGWDLGTLGDGDLLPHVLGRQCKQRKLEASLTSQFQSNLSALLAYPCGGLLTPFPVL